MLKVCLNCNFTKNIVSLKCKFSVVSVSDRLFNMVTKEAVTKCSNSEPDQEENYCSFGLQILIAEREPEIKPYNVLAEYRVWYFHRTIKLTGNCLT